MPLQVSPRGTLPLPRTRGVQLAASPMVTQGPHQRVAGSSGWRGERWGGEAAEKPGDLWKGPQGGAVGTACTSWVSRLRGLTPAVDGSPIGGICGRSFWQSPQGLSLERCRASPHPPAGPLSSRFPRGREEEPAGAPWWWWGSTAALTHRSEDQKWTCAQEPEAAQTSPGPLMDEVSAMDRKYLAYMGAWRHTCEIQQREKERCRTVRAHR